MKISVLLSISEGCGENYLRSFGAYGFGCVAGYLPKDPGYDALVLCGGGDIDPSYYGQKNTFSNPPDILRDKCEFSLFERYHAAGKPVFGICRGMQLINVALGGTLFQNIEESSVHQSTNGIDSIHKVYNMHGSCMHELYGEKMVTSSSHHQGCDRIGIGLNITQIHADKTVEGLSGDNIIAVQWHPERMTASFSGKLYSDPSVLFEYFKSMII